MSAPWRQYEKQIAEHFVASTTGAKVTIDEVFVGSLSGVSRKVEVVIRGTFPGYGEAMMIVDCKLREEKIDVAEVRADNKLAPAAHLNRRTLLPAHAAVASQRGPHQAPDFPEASDSPYLCSPGHGSGPELVVG